MIKPGDKVVCIDDSIQSHTLLELSIDVPKWVEKGKEYKVRDVFFNNGIVTSITLENLINPVKFFRLINKFQEPAFSEWRFRKVEDAPLETFEEERVVIQDLEVKDYSYENYEL